MIFVGTQQKGSVYAVVDRDGDRKVDAVHTVASGLNVPNGVAFKDGALYVAEINRILRYDDIAAKLEQAAAAGGGGGRSADREAARLEVHRVRPRRQALRAGGRALQHLRDQGSVRRRSCA